MAAHANFVLYLHGSGNALILHSSMEAGLNLNLFSGGVGMASP